MKSCQLSCKLGRLLVAICCVSVAATEVLAMAVPDPVGTWDWLGGSEPVILSNKLNPGTLDAVKNGTPTVGSGTASLVPASGSPGDTLNFGAMTNLHDQEVFSWTLNSIEFSTTKASQPVIGSGHGAFGSGGDPSSWGWFRVSPSTTAGSAGIGATFWGYNSVNSFVSLQHSSLGGQTIMPEVAYDMQFFFDGRLGPTSNIGFRIRPDASTTWGAVSWFGNPVVRISDDLSNVQPTFLGKYASGSSIFADPFTVGQIELTVGEIPPVPEPATFLFLVLGTLGFVRRAKNSTRKM